MHFVAGGAFNGKAQWVRNYYHLTDHESFSWVSAYREPGLPGMSSFADCELLIFEGIEEWLRGLSLDGGRESWRLWLDELLRWESLKSNRTAVVIGTDISKGIVPLKKADREHRDLAGWAYQDLAAAARRVDIIWYGIGRRLK